MTYIEKRRKMQITVGRAAKGILDSRERVDMRPIRSLALLLRYILLSGGIVVALIFASVQALPASAHSTQITQHTQNTDTTAFIRVVHASPDIGTVDVFVDGTKLLSSFQYATVTGYVPLP